jgi:protein TilB
MAPLTRDLIRRKSEHNEGTMADLEEISLHQLEIEKIENIDTLCRKLRILYLQNNIIGKMQNLRHLKELRYLNLALNNITRIQGLQSCEFLEKLDLTVNFIDVDHLASSIHHLKQNKQLRELYLVGNPCCDWDGCFEFVIASLPGLVQFNGKDITRSQRIVATQKLEELRCELDVLARAKRREKGVSEEDDDDDHADEEEEIIELPALNPNDECEHTPQVRTQIYREMAEEKSEKDKREKDRLPRERHWATEHETAVSDARENAFFEDGRVRQCNESKLPFKLDEDKTNVFLTVPVPRFVDTSLLFCDVQPKYVTVIVKNKVLRLALPEEVKSDDSKSERSTTTGELKLIMPKVKPGMVLMSSTNASRQASGEADNSRTRRLQPNEKLGDKVLSTAIKASELRSMYVGKENPNQADVQERIGTDRRSRAEGGKGGSSIDTVAAAVTCSRVEVDLGVPPLE